jgi:hypothetical protein
MNIKTILLTLALLSSPAYSGFVKTYSDWERLTEGNRMFYLVGVIDTLLDYNQSLYSFVLEACLANSNMGGKQLSDNLQLYVKRHPVLARGTVRDALDEYLQELCRLPDNKG